MSMVSVPPPPQPSKSWVPDRKIVAGGLAGVASWLILKLLAYYGFDAPMDVDTLATVIGWVAGIAAGLTAYIVPPSTLDVVKRLNADLIHSVRSDPETPAPLRKALANTKLASDPNGH